MSVSFFLAYDDSLTSLRFWRQCKIDNTINQNKINDCEYMKITSKPECFYYSYTQRFSFQNLTNIDYEKLSLV